MAELLLPLPMTVPALGVFEVTCEVPTGLVVVQLSVTLQLLEPEAMVHEGDESVPNIAGVTTVTEATFDNVPLTPFLTEI